MSKAKDVPTNSAVTLRRRAEQRLDQGATHLSHRLGDSGIERLVHELEVHQIELEMQNEELRAARVETEAGLERYTELFDFAPIGYATLDAEGKIKELNHVGARILGRIRSRLLGVNFAMFVAERDRETFDQLLARVKAVPTKEGCEVRVMLKGEARLYLRLTANALTKAEPLVLLAFEDVTEQRAQHEKLANAQEILRGAERRKDEFLAALSHELRNPLAPIRNSLYVLTHSEPGGPRAQNAIMIIDRQVTQLTRLIDDLLDVTRIARGKIELRLDRVELGNLVRQSMEDHRNAFMASGVHLEGEIEEGLFWVLADPVRLVQALSNLLSNAEKFTPAGGTVTVSVSRQGDDVVLRVRDNGAGIDPAVLKHVFEPFAQAPQTADRARGGLGLGLAMVKGLVELHGGRVAIKSAGHERGTEVSIQLPLTARQEASPPHPSSPLARSRRVMVIEDNPDAADSLVEALEMHGHQATAAYDGPSGLHLAQQFRPEIVICDIGLPGMDGYEVARAFRAETNLHDVFLIALSGYAQPEDVRRANLAGFDRHVAKPPRLETIDRVIGEAPAAAGSGAPMSNVLH